MGNPAHARSDTSGAPATDAMGRSLGGLNLIGLRAGTPHGPRQQVRNAATGAKNDPSQGDDLNANRNAHAHRKDYAADRRADGERDKEE